jgi:hypothetical protein
MRRQQVGAVAFALALAFAGQPALAKGSKGGGGRSGPRVRSGGVAGLRHPRPGPSHGVRRYGGHYRPYYGSYRSHGPRFYGSFSIGWPFYYSTWPYYSYYYPYYPYYPDYYPAPSAVYDAPDDAPATGAPEATAEDDRPDVARADLGHLRLEVRPEDTSVYVDDEFRGTASEARALELPPGRHVIELVRPGYRTERRELAVVRGANPDVLVEMRQPR